MALFTVALVLASNTPVLEFLGAAYRLADQAAVGLIVVAVAQLVGDASHAPEPAKSTCLERVFSASPRILAGARPAIH